MLDTGGPRVLVVDDEPSICRLLEALLAGAGYRVDTAQNGAAFLEAFDRLAPDLCVLDYSMPDMNGLTVLERLRERRADVPVIMLTSQDSAATATAAVASRAL